MVQEIILEAKAEMPIRPLLESAIRSELDKIRLAIFRTNKRLGMFERKYGMTSQEFAKKIENAELKESIDYIEWLGEIETLALLDEKKNALIGVNFVDRGIF